MPISYSFYTESEIEKEIKEYYKIGLNQATGDKKKTLEAKQGENIALLKKRIKNTCFWDKVEKGEQETKSTFSNLTAGAFLAIIVYSYYTKDEKKEADKKNIRNFKTSQKNVWHFHPIAFVEHMKLITGGTRAPWMEIAIAESKKAKGCVENLEPMYSMAKSYLRFVGNKFEPTDGTYGPWCASFMNWCMNESGYKYAKSASSLAPIHNNFKAHFRKIEEPIYGCIVVYKHKTKWKGHTGFLYGLDKDGNYLLLGGNQGNTINIEKYGEYTSKSKSKKLYGFYVPIDYKISEADYLTVGFPKNRTVYNSNLLTLN
ncbi:TIGR02594 family protein [Cellulophaga baltica]|uniref:TIGR02594 family protein n=1 Tax=Cellulophaga baltica TaxID=76594 RepID=UPI0003FE53BB|nr:TIGR02594 family protein [Cellulophaga baltica]AIY14638.1 hypothetical protein M667_16470 [Cellulophaga baltica NN016038]